MKHTVPPNDEAWINAPFPRDIGALKAKFDRQRRRQNWIFIPLLAGLGLGLGVALFSLFNSAVLQTAGAETMRPNPALPKALVFDFYARQNETQIHESFGRVRDYLKNSDTLGRNMVILKLHQRPSIKKLQAAERAFFGSIVHATAAAKLHVLVNYADSLDAAIKTFSEDLTDERASFFNSFMDAAHAWTAQKGLLQLGTAQADIAARAAPVLNGARKTAINILN